MRWGMAIVLAVAVLLAGIPVAAAPAQVPGTQGPRADHPEDRYALAGGCYAMRSVDTGRYVSRAGASFVVTADRDAAEPFHFQATDLGRYLLYGRAADHLVAAGDSVQPSAAPSDAAVWEVQQLDENRFTLGLPATGQLLTIASGGALAVTDLPAAAVFGFERADGCALYPEVELNVSGPHLTGATPFESVSGYVDTHLHVTAFEFLGGRAHCGRPWHPFGVAFALVDCPDHGIADGTGAILENVLAGDPLATHDTTGWPTFVDWPAPASLTHEQTYIRWIERAWRGGLRVLVNLFVENRVLCEIYPLKQNDCDEMASVRLQAQRLRELERYIDAQSGGPGEGWFRIVDDPFEARRIANEGRLAVVPGIEISEPFGCSIHLGVPQCSTADIDAQLDELVGLGVRQLVVIHKYDNALGGVTGDGGGRGPIVNLGNLYSTGRFWDMRTCDPDDTGVHDNDQTVVPGVDALHESLYSAVLDAFGGNVALPVYPPPHHCNVLGLSTLGAHAVESMADRGLLVDIDHMGVLARQQALDLLEARSYQGVLSSHSWATPDAYPRVYALGGMTGAYAGGSAGFVQQWEQRRAMAAAAGVSPFGLGFGADANGLGAQGGPRADAAANPVRYPFVGLGGVVIDRQRSGARVFDVNVDGVAHYGLYPDWVEDLRVQAGDAIVEDLARGAEAYLTTWERASGIAPPACLDRRAFDAMGPGLTPEDVLRRLGQPVRRIGDTFTYCVDGGEATVVFDGAGLTTGAPVAPPAPPAAGRGDVLPVTGGDTPLPLLLGLVILLLAPRLRRLAARY